MEKLRFYFYFISFAKTNRQTERTLAGTLQQLWPITAGRGFLLYCIIALMSLSTTVDIFKALPVEVSTGKWQCLSYSSTSSRISQVIDSPQDSCPGIIPVEVKNWYGSACVHHKADMGFSARDREEADQWLDEVQYSAEVSPTVTFDTGRSVNKQTQVQSNCTNYTRK